MGPGICVKAINLSQDGLLNLILQGCCRRNVQIAAEQWPVQVYHSRHAFTTLNLKMEFWNENCTECNA